MSIRLVRWWRPLRANLVITVMYIIHVAIILMTQIMSNSGSLRKLLLALIVNRLSCAHVSPMLLLIVVVSLIEIRLVMVGNFTLLGLDTLQILGKTLEAYYDNTKVIHRFFLHSRQH